VADDRRSGVCCRARSFDALPRPPSPTGRCWRSLQRVCLVPGRARISQWPAQMGSCRWTADARVLRGRMPEGATGARPTGLAND
jgi:hypothetical protein